MKKIILTSLMLFSAFPVIAQSLYSITGRKQIYRIDNETTTTLITTVTGVLDLFGDIAMSPSGKMYGVAGNNIYHIDLITGVATRIRQLPALNFNNLICSADYELYTIATPTLDLWKYNLLTNELTMVAHLGYIPSGDLTFYKGNLIYQTINPETSIFTIKAYNMETGRLADIFCSENSLNFFGLTSIFNECGNANIYGANSMGDYFKINFETQTFHIISARLPVDEACYGLASSNEYLGSTCEIQSIEDLRCSLSVTSDIKQEITVYPNPATDVLHFKDHDQIKSFSIYDVTGKEVKTANSITGSSVDIRDLTSGLYIIKLNAEAGYSVRKIVKK